MTKASLIDRKALTEALALACILQKTYGKTPAELETLTDGFLWVLGDDFPVADIVTAIGRYCRRQPDLPAPADIANILDPRDPRLSTALYVELSRRIRDGEGWITEEHRQFCLAYEEQELAKNRVGYDEQEI